MRAFVWAGFSASALALLVACSGSEIPAEPTLTTPLDTHDRGLVKARVLEVISATDIRVDIDGKEFRVRYLGVDVPQRSTEPSGPREKALEFNRFLVEGRTVELERGDVESDARGNLLRYVYVDGEMVNKWLIINGYAMVGDPPSDARYQTDFLLAEENAKSGKRGIWKFSSTGEEDEGVSVRPTATPVPDFTGGTLPKLPSLNGEDERCDYSGTSEAVIKGNVDLRTQDRVFHPPGGLFYNTTVVDENQGDRWLCTEEQAITEGWRKSNR